MQARVISSQMFCGLSARLQCMHVWLYETGSGQLPFGCLMQLVFNSKANHRLSSFSATRVTINMFLQ